MKIRLNKLKLNKFYKCDEMYRTFYFRYNGHDKDYIYCSGYYLCFINDYFYKEIDDYFCDINFYEKCTIFEEVVFEDIIEHLPKNNIDKTNYIRKNKINSLLKYE